MITRFAPSPTGHLHLGNIRTAFFNWLIAKKHGGVMQLRIEDTDKQRSRAEYTDSIMADLAWLGIDWVGEAGAGGVPILQSQQRHNYDKTYNKLLENNHVYPCFCTPPELAAEKQKQVAAGHPPRYSGKCKQLSEADRRARLSDNIPCVWRFAIATDAVSQWDDLVHGRLSFAMADFSDFVIRRSNGDYSFIYANAVDDINYGVTHVVRGDDHLSNTARQRLIFSAVQQPPPAYGHLPLIVGGNNKPLSKRDGLCPVRDLKNQGYIPAAIHNYLSRVGHHYGDNIGDNWATLSDLTAHFSTDSLGKSAAKYDLGQLLQRQKAAVSAMSDEDYLHWLGADNHCLAMPPDEWATLTRDNVLFPNDAGRWCLLFEQTDIILDEDSKKIIAEAGEAFFAVALEHVACQDWQTFCCNIRDKTGKKGKPLFLPLRAALTGRTDGPPMPLIFPHLSIPTRTHRLQKLL